MLPTNNLSQSDQTKATIDRSMMIAAYRYQIQTIRDRLASFPGSDREAIAAALDGLDQAEDYLTLLIDAENSETAA